ncbi:MAG: hypothetical protein RL710_1736 [Pseudomonadota bacterium]|jgi:hypothetical protein
MTYASFNPELDPEIAGGSFHCDVWELLLVPKSPAWI